MIPHVFGLTIHYVLQNQQLLIKARLKYYDLFTDILQTYMCEKAPVYTQYCRWHNTEQQIYCTVKHLLQRFCCGENKTKCGLQNKGVWRVELICTSHFYQPILNWTWNLRPKKLQRCQIWDSTNEHLSQSFKISKFIKIYQEKGETQYENFLSTKAQHLVSKPFFMLKQN